VLSALAVAALAWAAAGAVAERRRPREDLPAGSGAGDPQ
jgi:hypothetical protein